MLENKILRKIYGAKTDEISGKQRKVYNVELHYNKGIIRIKSQIAKDRICGKSGLTKNRWVDNIKKDLRIGVQNGNWMGQAQNREEQRECVSAAKRNL